MSRNLHESAMLARLSLTAWSGRKYDRKVSDEIAAKHGTTAEMAGNYNKILVAKDAIKKIQCVDNEIRSFHYVNTLPWFDDGFRILPAANFLPYTAGIRDLQAKRARILSDFAAVYPRLVDDARLNLNGLFDPADYPSVAQVMSRFYFGSDMMPLPNTADFRADLPADELAQLIGQSEQAIQDKINAAVRDVWTRVHEVVSRMATRLKEYKVTVTDGKTKSENVFRDSLVDNVRDLVDILPRLNFTDDAGLADIARRMKESLTEFDAGTLREFPEKRAVVQRSAESILADMAGYIGDMSPAPLAAEIAA